MKKILTIFSLCLLCSVAFADNRKVSGVVLNEAGEPEIGVAVIVTGTGNGTTTDYDGRFEISVPDDAKTLTFSYMGKETQTLPIAQNMRVVLKEHTEQLEEVIAVAYGTASKGSYVGSAQSVKAETIEKKNTTEISKALAGEVAGVQVVNSSGQPGTNATLYIRGIGSVSSGQTPLYVVDGIPYDGDISAIDPSDIESTSILKDATATALYGSRGSNGVVLLTTKKGTSGEHGKIDVDVKYGANMRLLPMYDVIKSPEEYVELAWLGIYNSFYNAYSDDNRRINQVNKTLFSSKGIPTAYNLWDVAGQSLIDGSTGKFYPDVNRKKQYQEMDSWYNSIFRIGQKAEATVKISGGSDKTTYYTSFGYLKDEGYYIGSDFSRISVRSNIQHQAKKWLKGGLNMAYAYTTQNNAGQGDNMNNGFAYVNLVPPIYPVYLYDDNGNIIIDPKTGGKAFDYGMREGSGRSFGSGINPAGSLLYDRENSVGHNINANGFLEIKFYKDLKFTANVGMQYNGTITSELTNPFYGDAAGIGRIYKQHYGDLSLTANQLLEYNKDIQDRHSVQVMAGHEINFRRISYMLAGMKNLASPTSLELSNAVQMSDISSNTSTYTIDSYFANAQYTYDNRYVISANYRADGSSRFAKGHRWGHFGSVGAAWIFTHEQFIEPVKEYLSNGKLRASWGVLGNQNIFANRHQDLYSIKYSGGQVAYVWETKGNEELTWERSQQLDIGLELSVGKYLDAEIDYYYKLTDNMLFPYYVAPSMGYSYYYFNGGEMVNQGLEMQFKVHAVNKQKVKLDIRLNGSHYTNVITALPEGLDISGSYSVGHSIYDIMTYEYAGVDSENGNALYRSYYDADLGGYQEVNQASTLRDEQRKGDNYIPNVKTYREKHPNAQIRDTVTANYNYAGLDYTGKSYLPKFNGGIGFDLTVYGVTLSANAAFSLGGYGYDGTYAQLMGSDQAGKYNWHTDIRNAWRVDMTATQKANATIPRLSNGSDLYANSASTRFLTSNSYISLNNVRLGYEFPKKLIEKIKLNYLQIWISGENLALASARKGYNPTTALTGSSDSYRYNPLSAFMGGIKFQF